MEPTAFDRDQVLIEFLTNYLDGNLTRGEQEAFEEYLAENEEERAFARKAEKGKKALAHFAKEIDTASVTA